MKPWCHKLIEDKPLSLSMAEGDTRVCGGPMGELLVGSQPLQGHQTLAPMETRSQRFAASELCSPELPEWHLLTSLCFQKEGKMEKEGKEKFSFAVE